MSRVCSPGVQIVKLVWIVTFVLQIITFVLQIIITFVLQLFTFVLPIIKVLKETL